MAKEVLAIPEECLGEVIEVIRAGLQSQRRIRNDTVKWLNKWCNEEEEYLRRLREQ